MSNRILIRDVKPEDYRLAMRYAIKGMHFTWYLDEGLLLDAYARAFFYEELQRATQALAATVDGRLVGILLAAIEGEEPVARSRWRTLYVRVFNVLQRLFADASAGVYERANRAMFEAYRAGGAVDGEILILAADPESLVRGVGTALLRELERREPGKRIHLYTDSACTYQFYEHRGFARVGERDITVSLPDRTVPLTCYLYSKTFPEAGAGA